MAEAEVTNPDGSVSETDVLLEEVADGAAQKAGDEVVKQTSKDILTRIKNSLNSSDVGKRFEATTAKLLDDEGIYIENYAQRFGTHDVDIEVEKFFIECKTNLNNRSASEIIDQVTNLFNNTGKAKEVILYSGKSIDNSIKSIQNIIEGLDNAGVKYRMIDNPAELLKILK